MNLEYYVVTVGLLFFILLGIFGGLWVLIQGIIMLIQKWKKKVS